MSVLIDELVGLPAHTPGRSNRWEAANIFGTWYVEWVTEHLSHIVIVVQGDDGNPLVFPSKLAAEKRARRLNRAAGMTGTPPDPSSLPQPKETGRG